MKHPNILAIAMICLSAFLYGQALSQWHYSTPNCTIALEPVVLEEVKGTVIFTSIEVIETTESAPIPDPTPTPIPDPIPETPQYVYYDLPLSDQLQEYTQDLCKAMEVDYPLVLAIMSEESWFDPKAISPTDDWGIMQINSSNHLWLERELGITDWLDPQQNIYAGIYILSLYSYLEDRQAIAMFFNSGPSTGKSNLKKGIFTGYSVDVMTALADLETRIREVNFSD